MAEARATERGVPERGRLGLALAIALLCSSVFWWARQEAFWSDGRVMIVNVDKGRMPSHHVLLAPILLAWCRLLAPLGVETRTALEALSSAAAGAGAGLLFLAARTLGRGPGPALLAVLLAASTPVVWFYATTVEVHALQFLAVAAALLWATREVRRAVHARSAPVGALAFVGMAGTHMTGGLTLPPLAIVLSRGGGGIARGGRPSGRRSRWPSWSSGGESTTRTASRSGTRASASIACSGRGAGPTWRTRWC